MIDVPLKKTMVWHELKLFQALQSTLNLKKNQRQSPEVFHEKKNVLKNFAKLSLSLQ